MHDEQPERFIKVLGQLRPANTTAAAVYTKTAGRVVWLDKLFVCNNTTAATCRVCLDANGSTYDQTTALYYDYNIADNTTLIIDIGAYLETEGGSIGVRTSINDALTFTLFGEEAV